MAADSGRPCQERRCPRNTAPSVARVPAPSLAASTELQRSRKQQKTGWAAPMLSGSVARQELEQERVTMGLWSKGYSAGWAGVRACTHCSAHLALCVPLLLLTTTFEPALPTSSSPPAFLSQIWDARQPPTPTVTCFSNTSASAARLVQRGSSCRAWA